MKTIKHFYILLLFFSFYSPKNCYGQLTVDAGSDTTFCAGPYFSDTMFIGKNAKIKNAIDPYSVSWNCKVPLGLNSYLTASSILNDTKIISPYIVFGPTITDSIKFYLTVSDNEDNFATDSVCVHFSFYPLSNDYQVIYLNKGDSVWLNGGIAEGKTDSIYWQPKEGLSNPDQASTWCKPDTTTDYYCITVDSFGCACPRLTYVVRVLTTSTKDFEFSEINKMQIKQMGSKIYFENNMSQKVFVNLFSLDGKLLHQFTTFSDNVDLSWILPERGMFIVKTLKDNDVGFCKFLKY
jgi:hypothetical protein